MLESGVTPILYYDALDRLIKTELPDGTLSRTEFDSWKQADYDPNDTVLESSWYHNRTNHLIDAELIAAGKDPHKEKLAADKAAKHANTPTTQHFDTLGRPVLSVEHNRSISNGADEFFLTQVNLDIEGNLRKVTDARGNVVMQYKYDMLGNKIYQHSMDAGQRWLLINILGNPLRTWDERDYEFQYFYDILHRPTHSKVIGGDGDTPLKHIFDRIFYGETEPNPELKNLRGQVVKQYDTGGLIETPEYDFKDQPISTTRQLFKDYKGVANWVDANLVNDLETDSFTFTTETDALGRITRQTAPDGSIITPFYNEAGLLNAEQVKHPHLAAPTPYIKGIDYNEKGQRNKIIYGNDVITQFYYDQQTFRLNRLETKRQNNDPLQDWYYTFDPVDNITHIEDKNIPVVFFNNQKIAGVSTYTYDALYRLAEATGRENDTSLAFDSKDNWNDAAFMKQLHPGDPMAMRNYTQYFRYDSVGNIQQMRHQAANNTWTRDYNYQAANNRLISTQIGVNTYVYPHHAQHGYMTAMPHLEEMGWNFKEELVKTIRQKRTNGGTPETTYYQYDGQGQRIRKITENQASAGDVPSKKDERIYIAGYELYKQDSGTNAGLERTSLSLMDEQHRFVMIDTETKPRVILGVTMGRTNPSQTVRYQLHNHLGSACLELDDAAQVISYEEYHPYGTTAYQAKNTAVKAAAKRYRYTGMERDEESGLEYHGARYYAPWLGRWNSTDPEGIGAGAQSCLYAYVGGNPITFVDDSGRRIGRPPVLAMSKRPAEKGPFSKLVPGQLFVLTKTRGVKRVSNQELIMEAIATEQQIYVFTGELGDVESNSVAHTKESILEVARSIRREAIRELGRRAAKQAIGNEISLNLAGSEKGKKGSFGSEEKGVKATKTDVQVKIAAFFGLETSGDPRGKSGGVPGGQLPDAPGNTSLQQLWMLLNTIGATLGMAYKAASRASMARLLTSRSALTNKTTLVYQLVDVAGDPVYIGISKDYRIFTRLGEHAEKYRGNFQAMQIISNPLLQQEAKLLETKLFREIRPILNTAESSLESPIDKIFIPSERKPSTSFLNPYVYPW